MLKPLSRDTLTQQATVTIRRFIVSAELKPGSQLPSERDLSDSLSVSRNIVREALSVLVAEGLIEKKAGRGIFVQEYDPLEITRQMAVTVDYEGRDLKELSEARRVVELGAAGLMAERITAGQIEELRAINRSLAENLRANRSTIRDDVEFHKVLLQATHNSVLIELIPLLVEHFRLTVMHQPKTILQNDERVVAEHQQIIAALETRDPSALQAALLAHPFSLPPRTTGKGAGKATSPSPDMQ
jgi:GntR family transcriptional repressor for pyruvate dehydrogenase complex